MAKKKRKETKRDEQTPAPELEAAPSEPDNSKVWAAFAVVTAIGSGKVAKKVLNSGWKAATGKEPPANPADPDVQMAEAVAWAVASGTAVALVKMLASRRAANYYVKSTGHLPGQLAADKK